MTFNPNRLHFNDNCIFLGLTISAHCPGLMVTSSFDGTVKIWDILDNKPSFVHEIKLPLVGLSMFAL